MRTGTLKTLFVIVPLLAETGCTAILDITKGLGVGRLPGTGNDLSIEEVTTAPFPTAIQSNVTPVKARVRFCCKLTSGFKVDLVVKDKVVDTKEVSPKEDSGYESLGFVFIPRDRGEVQVSLRIDPDNRVSESNENNNRRDSTVQVLPNLSADLSISSISVMPVAPKVGESVRVYVDFYYCCNPEFPVEAELVVDREVVQSKEYIGKDRGQERIEFSWVPKVASNSLIEVTLDPRDLIPERFEYPNKATRSVRVTD